MVTTVDTPLANITFTTHNFTMRGLDNYDFKEFHYDPETMTIRARIEFDPVPLVTFYESSGHIAGVTLNGKGFAKSIYGPINATFEINGELKQIKGIDYYHPEHVKVGLDMGESSHYVGGLFVDNQRLARAANNMLNANSDMVSKALAPFFEKLSEIGIMKFMKSLTRVPYKKIFPSMK